MQTIQPPSQMSAAPTGNSRQVIRNYNQLRINFVP